MCTLKKRNLIIIIIAALFLGAAVSSCVFYAAAGQGNTVRISAKNYAEMEQMAAKYGKLEMLSRAIDANYYKDVDPKALELGTYRGLFYELDDMYSYYMTAEEYESTLVTTSSEFQGIGITFSYNEQNNLVVVSTMDDSPALKAGLKTGDVILMIDDVPYTAKELNEAGSAMRGKPGTKVKLTILRGGVTKEYTITRANIIKHTVKSEMLPGDIAYIRISAFEDKTGEDFQKELRDIELKGAKGMIIDLRDNGGGIVDAGVMIADLLLPEGTIVYLEDNNGERKYYNSDENATNIPYVLLINGGTASTSEILAAAVKDNEKGHLVGTKTYGKGIVQSVIPLSDGSGDAIRLTTMQYYSPEGNVIHEKGIEPDYPVEANEDQALDDQLQKALELLKE